MLELTRAANLICDEARASLLPSFRLAKGRLVVQSGPDMDFTFKEFVVQYRQAEQNTDPVYPGLERFKKLRSERDRSFGKG